MTLAGDVEVLRRIPLFAEVGFTDEELAFLSGDKLSRQGTS